MVQNVLFLLYPDCPHFYSCQDLDERGGLHFRHGLDPTAPQIDDGGSKLTVFESSRAYSPLI